MLFAVKPAKMPINNPLQTNSTDGLLYGVYQEIGDNQFLFPATSQSLTILNCADDVARLRYEDADLWMEFDAIFAPFSPDPNQNMRPRILIDFRSDDFATLQVQYGRWRRLSWFLLDAVLVWAARDRLPQHEVGILGGWLDAEWDGAAYFSSSFSAPPEGSARYFDWPLKPYAPTALDIAAPQWRFLYEVGRPLACEVWLEARLGANGWPVLDETTPLADQIGNVPRFVSDAGTILFFNRIDAVSGPEYAAWSEPIYGLLGATHVYYLDGSDGCPTSPVIPRRESQTFEPTIKATEIDGNSSAVGSGRTWLHPLLREEAFFATIEATLESGRLKKDNLPAMCSRDMSQTCKVGERIRTIDCCPISVGHDFGRTGNFLVNIDRLFETPDEAEWRIRQIAEAYGQQIDAEQSLRRFKDQLRFE